MVDALVPAVDAMMAYTGNDITAMFELAAKGAAFGYQKTRNYQARQGRAKSLLERSIGHLDAGAASTWIIFRSMAEWLKAKD